MIDNFKFEVQVEETFDTDCDSVFETNSKAVAFRRAVKESKSNYEAKVLEYDEDFDCVENIYYFRKGKQHRS